MMRETLDEAEIVAKSEKAGIGKCQRFREE